MSTSTLELPGWPLTDERQGLGEELRHGRHGMGTGGDPVLPDPGRGPVQLHPAGPVPVRPRLRDEHAGGHDRRRVRLQEVPVPRDRGHGGHVDRPLLGDLDRVGPRVRVPARDAGGPVSRTALVSGKTLGGASIATVQGTIMLALAPLIGVRLTWLVVVEVIGLELLMAVTMTAFGVFVASHIQRMEGFSVVMQLLLFPMLFLSGPCSRSTACPAA